MRPVDIKKRALHILHLDESPHVLAKSFAVGVLVAFTPFMGLHTITVLLLAWAMRLNKVAAITGTLVNNPWTIALIYIGSTWLAAVALRGVGIHVPPIRYDAMTERLQSVLELYSVWQPQFWHMLFRVFKRYIMALFLGTTVVGISVSAASYIIVYNWIKYHRASLARRQDTDEVTG